MKEVISIHIGQAGVQMGSACWELYALEHGLTCNGYLRNPTMCTSKDNFGSFFEEAQCGRYVPRSIFVDLEPTVIDEIRNNQYRDLFHPDRFVTGFQDASNNYGRGHGFVGRIKLQDVMERLRAMSEVSDSLSGFILYHSLGGGTGSGFTTLLMEEMNEEYDNHSILQVSIFPSPRLVTSIVEPYNAILASSATLEICDCSFLMDNEALYNICQRHLDVDAPNYVDLNRIISQTVAAITAPLRFEGSLNVDLNEFQTNLVPFKQIHFPVVSYAPLIGPSRVNRTQSGVGSITSGVFQRENQMVSCDPCAGKYMACCMLYRGLVPPTEIMKTIPLVKDRMKFVNWCPTAFKIGINYQTPVTQPCNILAKTPVALCMLANTTAIVECWARLDYKFDLLFAKRAFFHWYKTEGMEEEEFVQARKDMASLERDYEECESDRGSISTSTDSSANCRRTTTEHALR